MSRRPFTITKVEQNPEGYWQARVVVDGNVTKVDARYGSWRLTPRNEGDPYQSLLPIYAAEVQTKVRRLSRRTATEEE